MSRGLGEAKTKAIATYRAWAAQWRGLEMHSNGDGRSRISREASVSGHRGQRQQQDKSGILNLEAVVRTWNLC